MTDQAETICPNCYSANPAASAFCSTCGGKINIEPSRSLFIEKQKPVVPSISIVRILGLLVFVLVGGWIIHWIINGGLYKNNSGPTGSTTQPTPGPSNPSPPTGSSITVGTNITLDGSNPDPDLSMTEITVCISEFYMDQYIEALQKKDFLGAYELTQSGVIFHVPNGTHGLLLEMSPQKAKVRIYGPPDSRKKWKYFGQVGWVLPSMVKAK